MRGCRSPFRLLGSIGLLVALAAESVAQNAPMPDAEKIPVAKPRAADAEDRAGADKRVAATGIVARVDDVAILLDDVIGPARGRLEEARKRLPAEQYDEYERELLRQATQAKIEQVVLLKELELHFKEPQMIDRVRGAAAKDFEKYLAKLGKDAGLSSREEVIARLKSEGSNVDEVRRTFIDNMLAQQFLQMTIRPMLKEPTRQDLYGYYREHQDEFSTQAGAVWRQVQINFGNDVQAARQKADQIHRLLKGGEDFAEIAAQASEGPLAKSGGLWSLTSKGSYADKAVDNLLFSIPVGEISGVIQGDNAFHIVRVEERNDGDAKPFSEVQDQIRRRLENEAILTLRREKLQEIKRQHYIETLFDANEKAVDQFGRKQSQLK